MPTEKTGQGHLTTTETTSWSLLLSCQADMAVPAVLGGAPARRRDRPLGKMFEPITPPTADQVPASQERLQPLFLTGWPLTGAHTPLSGLAVYLAAEGRAATEGEPRERELEREPLGPGDPGSPSLGLQRAEVTLQGRAPSTSGISAKGSVSNCSGRTGCSGRLSPLPPV